MNKPDRQSRDLMLNVEKVLPYQIRQDSFLVRSGTMNTTFPSILIASLISRQAHREPGESEKNRSLLWYHAMFFHPDKGDNIATDILHSKVRLLQEEWKAVST